MKIHTTTTSKHKIYTAPEGIYNGSWSGNFCWLNRGNSDETFYRFETKHSVKRTVSVTVEIKGVKAFVITKTKIPNGRTN